MGELSKYPKRAEIANTLRCSIAETAVLPERDYAAAASFPLATGYQSAVAPAVFRGGLASG